MLDSFPCSFSACIPACQNVWKRSLPFELHIESLWCRASGYWCYEVCKENNLTPVSLILWKSAKKSSADPNPYVQFTIGHKTLESKVSHTTLKYCVITRLCFLIILKCVSDLMGVWTTQSLSLRTHYTASHTGTYWCLLHTSHAASLRGAFCYGINPAAFGPKRPIRSESYCAGIIMTSTPLNVGWSASRLRQSVITSHFS